MIRCECGHLQNDHVDSIHPILGFKLENLGHCNKCNCKQFNIKVKVDLNEM